MDRNTDAKRSLRAELANDLVWEQDYSVGNEQLDFDHMFIFNAVNRFKNAVRLKFDDGFVETLFVQMFDHADTHFNTEEEYMAAIGFPGLAAHRDRHTEMKAELKRLHRQFGDLRRGDAMAAGEPRLHGRRYDEEHDAALLRLLIFLNSWWVDHIIEEDREYKFYAERVSAGDEVAGGTR